MDQRAVCGGKTHAADEIHRRLPGSVICDPEHLAYGLHRMTPPHLRGNFQDMSASRQGTLEVLHLLLTIAQTAEAIAASAGLALKQDSRTILGARAHQTWVTIKHIRAIKHITTG